MTGEAELSKKSVGRAAIWATLANSSGQIMALATFLLLARFIPPAEFGAMAVALTAIEFFKQVGVDPPAMAVLAKREPEEKDYNASLTLQLGFAVIVAIGLFLSAETIAGLLGRPRVADALEPISAMIVLLALGRTHEAWLARRLMFRALLARAVLAALIGGAVGVTMAIYGFGLWALVAQQLAFASTAALTVWTACAWRPRPVLDGAELKTLFSTSRHIGAGGAFKVIGRQSDIVVAGAFLGLDRAGIYNGAKRLTTALQLMLNAAMNQIALPSLARLSGDDAQLRAAVLRSLAIVSFVTAPAYWGISAISTDLVDVLFGDAWRDVAPILAILSIAGVFHALEEVVLALFLAKERAQWTMYFTAATAATNLLVIILAAPFGLEAVAAAYTLRVVLFFPVVLWVALRLVYAPMVEGLRAIAGALLAAGLMAALVWGLQFVWDDWPRYARLPTLILVGAAAYVALSALVNRAVFLDCRDIAMHIVGWKSSV